MGEGQQLMKKLPLFKTLTAFYKRAMYLFESKGIMPQISSNWVIYEILFVEFVMKIEKQV
jgi:hypothetical protein